ncbi:MAG: hypothetical protein R3F55_10935 [Alphaproteobacteria bacterium]
MLVELNTPDEVFGMTISSPCGATASITCASTLPLAACRLEILWSRLRSRPSRVRLSITV